MNNLAMLKQNLPQHCAGVRCCSFGNLDVMQQTGTVENNVRLFHYSAITFCGILTLISVCEHEEFESFLAGKLSSRPFEGFEEGQ